MSKAEQNSIKITFDLFVYEKSIQQFNVDWALE